MRTALRVEFFFDDEAQNWHYRVPALHINGGGAPSRGYVEAEAMEAIAFALQGDPRDYDGEAEATEPFPVAGLVAWGDTPTAVR